MSDCAASKQPQKSANCEWKFPLGPNLTCCNARTFHRLSYSWWLRSLQSASRNSQKIVQPGLHIWWWSSDTVCAPVTKRQLVRAPPCNQTQSKLREKKGIWTEVAVWEPEFRCPTNSGRSFWSLPSATCWSSLEMWLAMPRNTLIAWEKPGLVLSFMRAPDPQTPFRQTSPPCPRRKVGFIDFFHK